MNQLTAIATGLGGYAEPCGWCGFIHRTKCPLIKAVEYHPDGAVKRVEFHEPQSIVAIGPKFP